MPECSALVDVARWVDVKPGKDMMLDRQLKLTLASGKMADVDVSESGEPPKVRVTMHPNGAH